MYIKQKSPLGVSQKNLSPDKATRPSCMSIGVIDNDLSGGDAAESDEEAAAFVAAGQKQPCRHGSADVQL